MSLQAWDIELPVLMSSVMRAGLETPAPQTHAKQFLIGLKDPAELMNLEAAQSPGSSYHSDVEVRTLSRMPLG